MVESITVTVENVMQIITNLKAADNDTRKTAETTMNELREKQARGLFSGFVGVI